MKDFADKTKKIAICAPQVPCGTAAVKIFSAAKITPAPDTLEQDAKATLQKVSSNEVERLGLPDGRHRRQRYGRRRNFEARQAVNVYPIAVLKGSMSAAAAQQFVDYVLSANGRAVLREAASASPRPSVPRPPTGTAGRCRWSWPCPLLPPCCSCSCRSPE